MLVAVRLVRSRELKAQILVEGGGPHGDESDDDMATLTVSAT